MTQALRGGRYRYPSRLFCYGTLMFPALMRAVCGCRARPRPAVLSGYARHALEGEVFPGIVPRAGASVRGVVYEGLTAAQLCRLDRYEGDYYRRCRVAVRGPSGARLPAWVYVVAAAYQGRLRSTDWEEREFGRAHRIPYLRRLRRARPAASGTRRRPRLL